MKVKIGHHNIDVYSISDQEYLELNSEHKLVTNLKYARSRHILEKQQIKDIKNEYHYSISHTRTASAVAFSKNKNIGLDIEALHRNMSTRLKQRLNKKSKKLDLSELELWCLMESTYKSKNLKSGEDFISYNFIRSGDTFILKDNRLEIGSKVFCHNELIYSVSVYL